MPTQKITSSVADFKQKFGIQRDLLDLPSGLTVRARTAGMRAFIAKGLIPNSLMAIVTEALDKGQEPNAAQIMLKEDGEPDMAKLQEMSELFDAVACDVLVDPQVHPVPTQADLEKFQADTNNSVTLTDPDDLRSDELLYVDELDTMDKIFIFNWAVSGVKDLETFRQGLQSGVDAVANGKDVQPARKRPARARAR